MSSPRRLQSLVRSSSFFGGAKVASPDEDDIESGPTLPPQESLKGAKVSVVDTSAAVYVPGSIDLNRHSSQSFRNVLRRRNAVKRKEGRSYETGRKGERVYFEDRRDEAIWRGSRRSKRSSTKSIGTELLPLPMTAQPSSAMPWSASRHRSIQRWTNSVADANPSGTATEHRWPFTDSKSCESSDTIPAPAIDEDALPQWLHRRLRLDRSRAGQDFASPKTINDRLVRAPQHTIAIDSATGDRLAKVPRHTVVVGSAASSQSHSALIETATPSLDGDEARANRLERQRARESQLLTTAWWKRSDSHSEA